MKLHDTDKLQLKGDTGHWQYVADLRRLGYTEEELEVAADWGAIQRGTECYTVKELRTLEGRRHSTADQEHLDTAATHAAKVLDRLHSAGARVPGTSQQREADIEQEERAAAAYAPPDSYASGLAALRAASASTASFEEQYTATRLAALNAEHDRMTAHLEAHRTERLRTAEGQTTYPSPDAYGADLKKLREKEAR